MAFNNYLEEEKDKPYFTQNSLAYYYDKMEGFSKAVEGSAKALNLTKEEVEKRLTLYIEQNKNELDQRLAQWDGKLKTFDSSVEKLLTEWVDEGTLTPLIDSTLIDQKIAPVTAQLTAKVGGLTKAELENLSPTVLAAIEGGAGTSFDLLSIPQPKSVTTSTISEDVVMGKMPRVNQLKYSLDNPFNPEGLTVDIYEAYNKYDRTNHSASAGSIGLINWLKCVANQAITTSATYLARVYFNPATQYAGKKITFKFHVKADTATPLIAAINYTSTTVTNQTIASTNFSTTADGKEQIVSVSVVVPGDTTRLYFNLYSINNTIAQGSTFYIGAPSIVKGEYVPDFSIHADEPYYTEAEYDNKFDSLETRILTVEENSGVTPIDSNPMLVIISDDARIETYNLWKPLLIDKKIPISIAPMLYNQLVDSNWNTGTAYVSPVQMLELQDLGAEFVNHGNKSVLTATVYGNYSLIKQELVDSKKLHRDVGIDRSKGYDYYVYPGNIDGTAEQKANYKSLIAKYFKCGINNGVDTILNTNNPVDVYDIPRVNADSKTSTFLIGKMNEAIAVGGVLLLLSHDYRNTTHEAGDTSIFYNRFNPLIDHAKANGVKIVTLTEMLELKGLVVKG